MIINSLFDDVPAIPDCTAFLNYEPFKRKYGTPEKIASEMLDEAKRWNELVCILDEAGDERLSFYYADFSEQITDKLLPMLNDAVSEVMNTVKGRKML